MMTLDRKRMTTIVSKAGIMKKNMMARGLTKAKAKCPFCDGYWHAVLAGPKQHIHFKCDGDCKTMMMS